jgi:hypothetical protein
VRVKQRQSPAVTPLRFVVGLCLNRTAGEIEAAILARGKALEARAANTDRAAYLRLLRNDETLRLLKASRSVKATMTTIAEAMPALLAAPDLPDTAESRAEVVDTFWNAATCPGATGPEPTGQRRPVGAPRRPAGPS